MRMTDLRSSLPPPLQRKLKNKKTKKKNLSPYFFGVNYGSLTD